METRNPKIVVLGPTYVDMAVKCPQIPSVGQYLAGTGLSYTLAGRGPLQAVQAALCGCHVHLISKAGGDSFAHLVAETLSEYEVNTEHVQIAEAKMTGVIVTMVTTIGGSASVVHEGANKALSIKDIEAAEGVIGDADVLLVNGRLPQEVVEAALRVARLHRTKAVFNPAKAAVLDSDLCMSDACSMADVIVLNLAEAADVVKGGSTNIHTAKILGSDIIARGAGSVVITMGRHGLIVVDRHGGDHISTFDVEMVDHAGTGDAFLGALAACYGSGDGLAKAAKFASAAGALACTKMGALESLPVKAEIIELLQKEDGFEV